MNQVYKDVNDVILKDGDIIDIHQTVNGSNQFLIVSVNPLDIRYAYDFERSYEYDNESLLESRKLICSVEWEIIDNIKNQK